MVIKPYARRWDDTNPSQPLLLSIVIPAHNEEGTIRATTGALRRTLEGASIPHEIVVVADHCTDGTQAILECLSANDTVIRWVVSQRPPGFGYAVQTGLDHYLGDAVCIVMADASDEPQDVITYYRALERGYECAFGSRWLPSSRVTGYPRHKLALNRFANTVIRMLFRLPYNDTTNAFKCYRREVIDGVRPLLSRHFNLTVELPLKAITRGYSYSVPAINWYNRTWGVSNLKIKEMGSRYLFILLYVWLEKVLSQGDYNRTTKVRTVARARRGKGA
jgi:dolichol-phosphate mannosyltransferase